MIGNVFDTHRLERARADVQRHLRQLRALVFQRGQQRVGEMQTRRRRGHRALMLGVDGLVTRVVGCVGSTLDIGRQRQFAVAFEQRVHALFPVKAQHKQFARAFDHLRRQAAVKQQPRARLGRF